MDSSGKVNAEVLSTALAGIKTNSSLMSTESKNISIPGT